MSKYFEYVFLLLTFVIGTTVGLYSATNFNSNINEINETRIARTVQDAVLAKIQEEYSYERDNDNTTNNTNLEENIMTVSASEKKLSISAEMVIKKNFLRCSHSEIKRMKIPQEFVNYTKRDVEEKYSGWTIEKFETDEIILSKDFDANCTDHYVIKEKDGKVVVYNAITEDKLNFLEYANIDMELLSEEEKNVFTNGIRLYGIEEVSRFIEDYSS